MSTQIQQCKNPYYDVTVAQPLAGVERDNRPSFLSDFRDEAEIRRVETFEASSIGRDSHYLEVKPRVINQKNYADDDDLEVDNDEG
jgi:hypothetical protein